MSQVQTKFTLLSPGVEHDGCVRRANNKSSRSRLSAMILVLGFASGAASAAPTCSIDVPVFDDCEIALDALHPTQSGVGMMQVTERAAKLDRTTDFIRYTSKHPVPVVQAPDGTFYMTDHHHLASTLHLAGAKRLTAHVIGRFDNPATFWTEMQQRQWVYLYDIKGNPITPQVLPARVADLANDPYRALAGYAQNKGYFLKTDKYFMEFDWARYFGNRMQWKPIDRSNLPDALISAGKLACHPEAKDLPGYAGPCPIAP